MTGLNDEPEVVLHLLLERDRCHALHSCVLGQAQRSELLEAFGVGSRLTPWVQAPQGVPSGVPIRSSGARELETRGIRLKEVVMPRATPHCNAGPRLQLTVEAEVSALIHGWKPPTSGRGK